MKLIKRFSSEEKINVYFETGYAAGLYINDYICGNEPYPIDDFIANYKGTMFGTAKFKEFIEELRDLAPSLKNKIRFIGIDMEFQKDVTERMLYYTNKNHAKKEYKAIMENKISTKIGNIYTDEKFDDFRKKQLFSNFEKYFKGKALCFMGTEHIKVDSEDQNFVKAVNKKHRNVFSAEIMYENSKRTIKEENEFKTRKVNDKYKREEYSMYGSFGINKEDKGQGILVLSDCHQTKML